MNGRSRQRLFVVMENMTKKSKTIDKKEISTGPKSKLDLVSKISDEIRISSRPEIQLAGNPSYFGVFSVIRMLVFEKWSQQMSRQLSCQSRDLVLLDKSTNDIHNSIRVSKIVNLGLRAIFKIIYDIRFQQPELCAKTLNSLLNILQGHPPESLVNEPTDTIEPLFELLMEMATYRVHESNTQNSDHNLSAISYSCLLSLAIAVGSTSKILIAITTLIQCPKSLISQNVKIPVILRALQKDVLDVIMNSDSQNNFNDKNTWFETGVPKNSLLDSFLVRMPFDAYPGRHLPKCITSDGYYLYILTTKGLFKVGSGYGETIKGHVYLWQPEFYANDKNWIGFCANNIYLRRFGTQTNSELLMVDRQSLRILKTTLLLEIADATSNIIFTDRDHLGTIIPTKDNGFSIRILNPKTNPATVINELVIKLSRKYTNAYSLVTYDIFEMSSNNLMITPKITGDIQSIFAGKDFGLLLTKNGKVFYCGKGASLGLKSIFGQQIDKWTELVVAKNTNILQISVGHEGNHVLFLAEDGSVYFCGVSRRGEDCDGTSSKTRKSTKPIKPKKINRTDVNSISYVACNSGTTALVTKYGEVLMFGKDTAFCDSSTGLVIGLKGEKIQTISLGKAHAVVLNDKGQVFTFGINNENQCGRDFNTQQVNISTEASTSNTTNNSNYMNYEYEADDHCEEKVYEDRIYDEFFPEFCSYNQHIWGMDECMICNVCKKCTGYSYDCLASKNRDRKSGEVCGCGLGDSGCTECGLCRTCAQAISTSSEFLSRQALSHGDNFNLRKSKSNLQKNVENISNSLMSIILSKDITIGKSRKKIISNVKTLSDQKKNENDFEKETIKASIISPGLLKLPIDCPVTQVACGLHHTVLLLQNGQVLTFGSNQYGQLGCGDISSHTSVKLVKIPHAAIQVAAGNNHTIVLTNKGDVYTMGSNNKDQLGRDDSDARYNDAKNPWYSFPGLIHGFGEETSRKVSWIGASGDQSFLTIDELLISNANLAKSTILSSKNYLIIMPNQANEALFKCLVINKTDGSTKSYTEDNQILLANRIACIDPFYNTIWSYDATCDEVSCYNSVASNIRNATDFRFHESQQFTEMDLFQQNGLFRRKPYDFTTILKAEITLPVEGSSHLTRSHMSMFLLCCLDTLNAYYEFDSRNKITTNEEDSYDFISVNSKNECKIINRFDGNGGGWGYSAHSVEALRFMCDKSIVLCGFGLFGGRGVYTGKIKVFDLGIDGGDQEIDGDLIAETDDVPFDCAPRHKYHLLLGKPILLHAHNWYVVWCKINGPSSDCGSSGRGSVIADNQITFHFKSSKKSNNGTDINAGQIPQILYREVSNFDSQKSKLKQKSSSFDSNKILTQYFCRNINKEAFQSLIILLQYSWNTIKAIVLETSTSQYLNSMLELKRFTYIAQSSLRLLKTFIQLSYPYSDSYNYNKKIHNEDIQLIECIAEVKYILMYILMEGIPKAISDKKPPKKRIVKVNEIYLKMVHFVIDECQNTFVSCFTIFYPTDFLKWNCLCLALNSEDMKRSSDKFEKQENQFLTAILCALCSPSIRLRNAFPLDNLIEDTKTFNIDIVHLKKDLSNAQNSQYPILVEYMTSEKGHVDTNNVYLLWTWSEVFQKLLLLITNPIKVSIQNLKTTVTTNTLIEYCCNLITKMVLELIYQFHTISNDVELSLGQAILKTPSRFSKINQSKCWNTGNGSPDAICFQVDRPGILIAGCTVYGGFGNFDYTVDLLDDYYLKSLNNDNSSQSQRWTLLETGKGSFSGSNHPDGIIELRLNKPILIKENVKYALRIRINGNRTSNGDCGLSSIKGPDDTIFRFSTCTLSFNGTTQLRGQIPNILYYSNPIDDQNIENEKLQIELQIRQIILSITSNIMRSFNDVIIEANTKLDENIDFINELLSNADIVTKLIPLVISQTTPLILSDARFAVNLLELIQETLLNVASINQMTFVNVDNIGSINQTIDSFSLDNNHITTSQYYTWVQSDHPYKPATVYNYRVVFPSNVKWFSLEFDPACCTAQVEDCLRIYIPCYEYFGDIYQKTDLDANKLPYWSVLARYSMGKWPQACTILPGNEVIFSLETASDYIKNDKMSSNNWGFRCLVIGYENPIGNMITGTNNNNKSTINLHGLKHLEVELAFMAGMCASNLMRKDINLPLVKDEEYDLEMADIIAQEVSKSHSILLSKGLSLNQFPTIQQTLDGHLTYRGHSNESLFLKNFINCTSGTSGNRLAQWLQPESRLDLRNSEVVYNLDEFKCGWPSTILIRTRDQYNEIVQVDDLKIFVYAIHADNNHLCRESGFKNYIDYEITTINVPYEPTFKEKMCFYAISMMKEYQNYSFEELRLANLCTKKSLEVTSIETNFDGTYTVKWTPKSVGTYTIVIKVDDQIMEKIHQVDVKDCPTGVLVPINLSSNITKKSEKSIPNNQKLRKFVTKYSSGLRIRTHPTLQSEQIGIVPIDRIISFIDEIHNDDGVWLRLSADSIKEYNQISGPINEAWCLQYNSHSSKTHLVPLDDHEPCKNVLRRLLDVNERKKLVTPFPNPAGYKVVKCGTTGHNVRSKPSLDATVVGTLLLGNVVTIMDHVANEQGYWVQLDQNTKQRYCFNGCSEAWSLAVNDNNVLYLQSVEVFQEENLLNLDVPATPKKERKFNHCSFGFKVEEEKLSVRISNENYQICSTSLTPNRYEHSYDQEIVPDNYKITPRQLKSRNNKEIRPINVKVKKAISASIAECVRAVFAAFLWHEGLVHDAMASATYLKFYPSLLKKESQTGRSIDRAKHRHSLEISTTNDNLLKLPQPETLKVLSRLAINHENNSNLPVALKSLLYLWNELSVDCLQTIRQQSLIFCRNKQFVDCNDIDDEVFLDDGIVDAKKISKTNKNWKSALQNFASDNLKSVCELCGEVSIHHINTHMRENHPGCQEETDGRGYNSKGYYGTGWSGQCGDIGIDNFSCYLLCSKCRQEYIRKNNMLNEDETDVSNSHLDNYEPLSSTSSSLSNDFHIIVKNNAIFLLTLSSSFPSSKITADLNESIGLSEGTNLSTDFISSFSTVPPCNSLKIFGIPDELISFTTNSSHSTTGDYLNISDRNIRPMSEITDEDLLKNLKFHRSISMCTNGNFLNNSCDNSKNKITCSNNNFINDSSGLFLLGNPSNNLQKVMLNYSRIYKIAQCPVLNFVYENHDLDSIHIAMRQSLRKAICRIYASQAFNWLLNVVSQPVSLHDILWWLVISLTYPKYDPENTDSDLSKKPKFDMENDLRIPDHPLSDLKMAGYAKKIFPKNFHRLLQTISDLMIIMPMGSALQQMAVRCWGLKFNPEDHNFLHQSHVFSMIGSILSRSDETDDCVGICSSIHENAICEYPMVEKLRDLTQGVEITTSSRPNLIMNLTDSSTETFWESGDEDRTKTKMITLNVPNSFLIYYICVHIDNSRDPANKVSNITYLSGRSADELIKIRTIEIENNLLGGWINCPMIYAYNTNVVRIDLKGPDATLRVRQIRILGEVNGESINVRKQLNAALIQQRNCEAETLRVFRLITSQVFEKLIKKEPTQIINNNNNNNNNRLHLDSGNLSFSDSFEKLDDNDLKEHMVGILFSRSKLTHLQKQIIVHIVQSIRLETQNLRDEWESQQLLVNIDKKPSSTTLLDNSSYLSPDVKSPDSYCFEMLSLVLALSGSEIGRTYLSNQLVLISDLLTLLHVGSARVQRQVMALLPRILSKISPDSFARILEIDRVPNFNSTSFELIENNTNVIQRTGLLDIFLSVIAKTLSVQLKNARDQKNRNLNVLKLSSILEKSQALSSNSWWIYGEASKKLAYEVINLINDMTSGKLSESWMNASKGSIAENLLSLTHLNEEERCFDNLINSPHFWLTLSSLCVMTQDHVESLSSVQWKNCEKETSRPLCTNHDDGETYAMIQCNDCGSLCVDCDRFLHLSKKARNHQRKVCKEEEESIKIQIHEGCGRIKLFWLLALADHRTLKALVEYRDSAHNLKAVATDIGTCRFCGTVDSLKITEFGNICSDLECQKHAKNVCQKTHTCGHLCGGVNGETNCLPCLHKCSSEVNLLQDGDDMCMICFTDALSYAPSIMLKCGHIFHHHCCRTILEKRWTGPRIIFTFSLCPICKVRIDHVMLSDLMEPITELYNDVKRKSLMRLKYEGNDIDPDTDEALGYAMGRYAYYVCYRCNKAYYGGDVRCEIDGGDNYDPTELVCGACSDVSRAQMCSKHGTDFLEYKCRYCCSVAVFFCFGTTHFCNACHDDFQRITTIPQIELPQCPAGPKGVQLEGDECPLHVKHPITGEEFALGCGVCRNAQTF